MNTQQWLKPEPTGMNRQQIFQFAEDTARDINYRPGDSLLAVVQGLKGRIQYVDFDTWHDAKSGTIEVDTRETFTIYLPDYMPHLRNRFTIAHELGHYFLHSNRGQKKIRADRREKGIIETEANYFAAAFLMPEKIFKKWDRECNQDDEYLSARFLVSEVAVRVRRESLNRQ